TRTLVSFTVSVVDTSGSDPRCRFPHRPGWSVAHDQRFDLARRQLRSWRPLGDGHLYVADEVAATLDPSSPGDISLSHLDAIAVETTPSHPSCAGLTTI